MTTVVSDYMARQNRYTCGGWTTERDSVAAFDAMVTATGLFFIYKEVVGRYQFLRPSQELKAPRIDRVLAPTQALIDLGWNLGPVGVECKRSNEKIGRPLGQLVDYTRAAWKIGHTWVVPEWHFLWPLSKVSGPIESVMAQQRIGGIHAEFGRLTFHCSGNLAEFHRGQVELSLYNGRCGGKTGSR